LSLAGWVATERWFGATGSRFDRYGIVGRGTVELCKQSLELWTIVH
jgi:hypothetical protein